MYVHVYFDFFIVSTYRGQLRAAFYMYCTYLNYINIYNDDIINYYYCIIKKPLRMICFLQLIHVKDNKRNSPIKLNQLAGQ